MAFYCEIIYCVYFVKKLFVILNCKTSVIKIVIHLSVHNGPVS